MSPRAKAKRRAWFEAKKPRHPWVVRQALAGCPTPCKRPYTQRIAAYAAREYGTQPNTPPLFTYLCRCGSWHLTKQAPARAAFEAIAETSLIEIR